MRILLVENHAVFAATVRTELLCDHDVHIVGTVAEALDTLDCPIMSGERAEPRSRQNHTCVSSRLDPRRRRGHGEAAGMRKETRWQARNHA